MLHGDGVDRNIRIKPDELEPPGNIGHRPHDLRIEQITQTDDGAADSDRYHNPIERPDIRKFILARKKPKTDQQADGSAVTGHAAVAEIRNDSPGMGKKIPRFIKKTVSQTGTEDRGQCAIDENRLRNLLGQPFAFTDLVEEKHAAENRQHPHQSVITDIERSDRKKDGIEIPDNGYWKDHTLCKISGNVLFEPF